MAKAKNVGQRLKKLGAKAPPKREPVWKGPSEDGITQSLLSRFLVCRERFRLLVIEGLRTADEFNHRLEYGHMWHVCEESLAEGVDWKEPLREYGQELSRRYPTQGSEIERCYLLVKTQFPIYVDFWKKHPDVKARVPIAQELVFDVPYQLPSQRIVRLRGKMDSVDLIKGEGIYLQENKTKGDINEQQLRNQLRFDLQTMLYLTALQELIDGKHLEVKGIDPKRLNRNLIKGVRYNVIRRPLSGGKHSIRQHKPSKSNPLGESVADFYNRLGGLIREEPEYFFMRWKVDILPSEIARFKRECLNPVLEELYDWWEFISQNPDPWGEVDWRLIRRGIHYRFPYGVYNPTLEGRSTDLDEYLETGSEIGLERVDNLFGEL